MIEVSYKFILNIAVQLRLAAENLVALAGRLIEAIEKAKVVNNADDRDD